MISDKQYKKMLRYARIILNKEGVSIPTMDDLSKVLAEMALKSVDESEIDAALDAERKVDLANEKAKLQIRLEQIDLEIDGKLGAVTK